MPTVEVFDGDLESALAVFKDKLTKEGISKAYKRSLAFTPEHEKRAFRQYKWERRKREKAGQ